MVTDLSEEHNASFFGIEINYEGESSKLLRNAVTQFTLQHSVVVHTTAQRRSLHYSTAS